MGSGGAEALAFAAERIAATQTLRGGTAVNSKAKGNRAEHRSMRLLEAAGYSCWPGVRFHLNENDICAAHADYVSVQECLLINPANTLDAAHVIGILSAQVARMSRFDLTVRGFSMDAQSAKGGYG